MQTFQGNIALRHNFMQRLMILSQVSCLPHRGHICCLPGAKLISSIPASGASSPLFRDFVQKIPAIVPDLL